MISFLSLRAKRSNPECEGGLPRQPVGFLAMTVRG